MTARYIFAGDSYAHKGFTRENNGQQISSDDVCLADYWNIPYTKCISPGNGNLTVLDKVKNLNADPTMPIVWVWTEPGRDYGRITGRPEFEWMEREDIWQVRQSLSKDILVEMKRLPNPIGLIGGLSDVDTELARELGFTILHPSWQLWIATKLKSQWFKFGWGALDIGWRAHYNNITPSKTAAFAWDEQIKEWCWWEEQGYFCHEHPTPLANKEFAKDLQQVVEDWVK